MNTDRSQKLCECGCGQPTKLAPMTNRARGLTRGHPLRFIHGHNSRSQGALFAERWRLDPETGCHVWIGRKNQFGYGMFGKPSRSAHRIAWEREHGPIPDGLQLDHLCRNRAYVNTAHLEVVTPAENTRRGLKARLTADDVRAIRSSTGDRRTLAARYGVTPSTISQIRHFWSWRDI